MSLSPPSDSTSALRSAVRRRLLTAGRMKAIRFWRWNPRSEKIANRLQRVPAPLSFHSVPSMKRQNKKELQGGSPFLTTKAAGVKKERIKEI
jgi:hypothetical protein